MTNLYTWWVLPFSIGKIVMLNPSLANDSSRNTLDYSQRSNKTPQAKYLGTPR